MTDIVSHAKHPAGAEGVVVARLMSGFHRGFYDLALTELGAPRGSLVLDAGCGVACHADLFRERGLSYLGVDQSQDVIVASTFDCPRDAFLIGNLEDVELPRMDGAVAINVTPWLIDPVAVFRNILSALMPGAAFVTGAPEVGCARRFREPRFEPLSQDAVREIYKEAGFRNVTMRVVPMENDYLITRGVR